MDALFDKIQRLDERLDDEVSGLKAEVVRNKSEIVKLEKELMNNKKKINEFERERATPVCDCKPEIEKAMKETSGLKLKVAVFEREFQTVKGKGETLTKLQSLLNSFLLKTQWSTQIDIQIETLQTRQESLSDEVKALEVALSDQQQLHTKQEQLSRDIKDLQDARQLDQVTGQQGATSITKESQNAEAPIQSVGEVYHSSFCRSVSINHERGIFTCTALGFGDGLITSAQPLIESCPSFSIQILSGASSLRVAIGVGPKGHDNIPGYGHGTVGYHSDNGRFYIDSGKAHTYVGECGRGDIMQCQLDFCNRKIHFFRNNEKVCTLTKDEFRPSNFHSLYACVALYGDDTEVKPIEKDPWRK